MTYNEALTYLDTPNFMNPDPGLENIEALLEEMGNPQDSLRFIHIAGTNGKGSTAAFTEQILRESGYRTGMYTSPYVKQFSEKLRICGEEISEEEILYYAEFMKKADEATQKNRGLRATVFEIVTAMAFQYFKDKKCDVVVLEVGLGGRLDATNVISKAEVSAITSIGLDHTDILGANIEKIAFEKAGIIKEKGRVVLYGQEKSVERVVGEVCNKKHATLTVVDMDKIKAEAISGKGQSFFYDTEGPFQISMLGMHQMKNASVALHIVKELVKLGWDIPKEAISKGLEKTRWIGRLEIFGENPLFLVDAAHNAQGAEVLAESLKAVFPEQKISFVLGVLADKAYDEMIDLILPLAADFFVVTPHSVRALHADKLSSLLREKGFLATAFEHVSDAVLQAKEAHPEGIICAFGSLYYIGDVIRCLEKSGG